MSLINYSNFIVLVHGRRFGLKCAGDRYLVYMRFGPCIHHWKALNTNNILTTSVFHLFCFCAPFSYPRMSHVSVRSMGKEQCWE